MAMIGQKIWVKPSEFLGTPGAWGEIVDVIMDSVTKELLLVVRVDGEDGVVDSLGVVCIGPPSRTAEYTRAP